jgi:hypothetical protein
VPAPGRSQRRRGACSSEDPIADYAYREDLTNWTTAVVTSERVRVTIGQDPTMRSIAPSVGTPLLAGQWTLSDWR